MDLTHARVDARALCLVSLFARSSIIPAFNLCALKHLLSGFLTKGAENCERLDRGAHRIRRMLARQVGHDKTAAG